MTYNDEATTKLGIPWPSSSVPANLSGILQEISQYLDGIVAQAKQVSALPSPGKFGSIYEVTGTGAFYFDNGTSMVGPLAVLDSRSADIAASSPGDTALAGSTGYAADAGHRHARETAATALVGTAQLSAFSMNLVDLGNMGASKALDLSAAREYKGVLSAASCTLSITNVPATANVRHQIMLALKQDATGGRTVTWPASVTWGAYGTPTLTTTANKTDLVTMSTDDAGATWRAQMVGFGY